MRVTSLAAVLLAVLSGPAVARTSAHQWALCRDEDAERAISGCASVIHSGQETPKHLARAFFNLGRAFSDSSQFDRAIQNFNRAIALDPIYPDAFNGRAIAYNGIGQNERAILDFDQAIRLDPNYAIAIYNRGLTFQSLGRTARAEQDFLKAKQVGPRLIPPKE
jgi:tetratricopeptide (TPR) repeat protein